VSRLTTFTTADGEEVTIQVSDGSGVGEITTRGFGSSTSVAERAGQNLDDALIHVQPAVRSLVRQLRLNDLGPDEFEVEFGIQLSVDVGAFISATTACNFRVTMRWVSH
jgi:Trypsin-co-occurring domain 1